MSHEIDTAVDEGYEVLVLRSPALEAAFAPSAGMVASSLRYEGEELLGRRNGLASYAREGKTMGIPMLHPWANRLATLEYEALGRRVRLDPAAMPVKLEEHGLPIHGLLAGDPRWRVLGHDADEDGARLEAEFDFTTDPALLAAFPFPHTLRLVATLRHGELAIATTLTAAADRPVPVAFGFHPYLVLAGVPRAEWNVELPALRRVELDARSLPTGAEHPQPPRAVALGDDVYDDAFALETQPATFALSGGGRRIAVEFSDGYAYAQVFAPPHLDVVCFEPMTAPVDPFREPPAYPLAQPGEPYRATFRVTVG